MSRRKVILTTFVKEEEEEAAAVFASPILKRLGGVETTTIAIRPKEPRKEAKEGKGRERGWKENIQRRHERHRMCNVWLATH